MKPISAKSPSANMSRSVFARTAAAGTVASLLAFVIARPDKRVNELLALAKSRTVSQMHSATLSREQIYQLATKAYSTLPSLKDVTEGYLEADGWTFIFVYKDSSSPFATKVAYLLRGNYGFLGNQELPARVISGSKPGLNNSIIIFGDPDLSDPNFDLRKAKGDPARDILILNMRNGKLFNLNDVKLDTKGQPIINDSSQRSNGSYSIPFSDLQDSGALV
jgi:hypothetical protein